MKAATLIMIFLILINSAAASLSVDSFRTAGPPKEGAKQVIKKFAPMSKQIRYVKKYEVPESLYGLKIARINGKKVYFNDLRVNKKLYKPSEKIPLREGSRSIYAKKQKKILSSKISS